MFNNASALDNVLLVTLRKYAFSLRNVEMVRSVVRDVTAKVQNILSNVKIFGKARHNFDAA